MFKKTILKNGLRVITIPQKNSRPVTVLVLAATGSKYEEKEISGISHLLEHMLFKGTKKRPDKIAISEPLDRVGGNYNAFTGKDYTGYYAKVDFENFDLALDIISDIYLNSLIDEKELEKEKKVVIEEINMYYDQPASYVQNLWDRVLYGDQPAGWDIAGTKKSVLGLKREQLVDYMKRQYSALNTVVIVAGHIREHQEVIKKVEKYFSGIKKRKIIQKKPVIFKEQNYPKVILKNKKTDQTHFCLGVRGYNLFQSEKYPQEMLALILGGMMSSRLFVKIREEMGLAYYIKTESFSDPESGYLVTQAGVDNSKADKAISAILEEYKRISEEKVPEEELEKAKEHFKGRMSLSLETSDAQASFYGLQEVLKKEILTPEQIYAKIDKVDTDDVLRVAKNIFKPEKLNLAIIGPFKNKKRFQKLLKF